MNINPSSFDVEIDFNTLLTNQRPNYEKLNNKISNNYKLLKEQFELFSGAFAPIYRVFEQTKPKHCFIYSPIAPDFKNIATKFGCEIFLIERFSKLNSQIKEDSLVIFSNPSFPDGKYYEMFDLLDFWKRQNATIIVDESFLDFTNEKSLLHYLANYPKLYILKSFTPFFKNEGIELSLLISSVLNINIIKEFEPKYKLSVFDVAYLNGILDDKIFKKISKTITTKNIILLEQILAKSNLFEKIYQSRTNFILVKMKFEKQEIILKKLSEEKIKFQSCLEFDFLGDNFLIFEAINEDEIKKLQKTLEQLS